MARNTFGSSIEASFEAFAGEYRRQLRQEVKELRRAQDEVDALKKELSENLERLRRNEQRSEHIMSTMQDTRNTQALVRFNIGGTRFYLHRRSLALVGDSVLAMLALDSKFMVDVDEANCIVIDRNPLMFHHIVEYLRLKAEGSADLSLKWREIFGRRHIDSLSIVELELLFDEANYFGLEELSTITSAAWWGKWTAQIRLCDSETQPLRRLCSVDCVSEGNFHLGKVLAIDSVALSPEEELVATGATDNTVCIFSSPSLAVIYTIPQCHDGYITALLWMRGLRESSTQELFLISSGRDGKLVLWSCGTDGERPLCKVDSADVTDENNLTYIQTLDVSGQETFLAGASDGTVTWWGIQDCAQPSGRLSAGGPQRSSGSLARKQLVKISTVRFAASVRQVLRWDCAQADAHLIYGDDFNNNAALSWVFVVCASSVERFSLDCGTVVGEGLGAHSDAVRAIAISPRRMHTRRHHRVDCNTEPSFVMVSGCLGGHLYLWDMKDVLQRSSATPYGSLPRCPQWISDIQFLPLDTVGVSWGTTISLFDVGSRLLLRNVSTSHTDAVRCFRLLPTASNDALASLRPPCRTAAILTVSYDHSVCIGS